MLCGCTIFGPKWPTSHMKLFFFFFFSRKPVKSCFFHSWLSTCHKSKSDIDVLIKYKPLKNSYSIVSSPFLQEGGLKNFQCWQKGRTCTFWIFRGEEWPKRGFFRGRAPEDFLKVIFNCWSSITSKKTTH